MQNVSIKTFWDHCQPLEAHTTQVYVILRGHEVLASMHLWESTHTQADKRTKSPRLRSVPAVRSGGVTETKTQLCHFITVQLSLSLSLPLSLTPRTCQIVGVCHLTHPPLRVPFLLFPTGVTTICGAKISLFYLKSDLTSVDHHCSLCSLVGSEHCEMFSLYYIKLWTREIFFISKWTWK